jgi:hypothetical protein
VGLLLQDPEFVDEEKIHGVEYAAVEVSRRTISGEE